MSDGVKIKRLARVFTVIVLSTFVVSCQTTTRGILRSITNYEQVFRACVSAANEADFAVTSSDMNSGLIAAQKALLSGNVTRLTITVKQTQAGVEVEVAVIPQTGSIGFLPSVTPKGMFDRFVDALKRKVPDVKIVSE